jgi:hypothetical protein
VRRIWKATHENRDSSVDVAKGYELGADVRFPAGSRTFSIFHVMQIGPGSHNASYPTGIGDFSLEVNRPKREAEESSPSRMMELYLHSLIYFYGLIN